MRETIEQSRLRLQEFEERQRRVKQEPLEASDVADYRAWQISNAEVSFVLRTCEGFFSKEKILVPASKLLHNEKKLSRFQKAVKFGEITFANVFPHGIKSHKEQQNNGCP